VVGDYYLLLLYHGSANVKKYTAENNMYRRVSQAGDNMRAEQDEMECDEGQRDLRVGDNSRARWSNGRVTEQAMRSLQCRR
jgi:hypothetical protein